MMAASEQDLLQRFRESGSRDALRNLLIAHQDRIYNVCFQVLRRAEDAEDAAQEALLKLAEGARAARDADAFRGWIYRVSLRAALDLWRRREATRSRETRAAMNRPAAPPLDDRERFALFEAMDGLDDRERSLLLEHYFEKVPLAALGERGGVSAVAIWKRIDHAREKLKKTLLGAGFLVASARVSEALEASVPATPPATLVGEAVLGKILAGGVAMGATKSSMIPALVLTLVLLFGVVTGGYVMFRPRGLPGPSESGPGTVTSLVAPSTRAASTDSVPSDFSTESDTVFPKSPLLETLERYRAWHAEYKESATRPHDPEDPRRHLRLHYEGFKRFKEARAQIFADPETFLGILRDPKNEELLDNMVYNFLGKLEQKGDRGATSDAQFHKDFPVELMDGFHGLLKSGSPSVKKGILGFLASIHDVPEKFDEVYEELMYDPDPSIQSASLGALWRLRVLDLAVLEKVRERFDSSQDGRVRSAAILAISYSPRPEPLGWMVDRMETIRDGFQGVLVAEAAVRMAMKGTPDKQTLDRIAKGMVATIGNNEWAHFRLIPAALELPVSQSMTILEGVLPKVVDPKLKSAVTKVLEQGRKESATPRELQSLFHQATLDR